MKTTGGGNAEKQSADPCYNLPKKSSKNYVQDNALYLAISVIGNIVLVLCLLFIALILGFYYKRTPILISQNAGFCYKRTTDEFQLNEAALKAFLRFTIEGLLSPRLDEQDPRTFIPFVDGHVVEATIAHLQKQKAQNRRKKTRYYWELENFVDDKDKRFLTIKEGEKIRRYDNPQLPQFMGFIVLGKRTIVQDFVALDGSLEKRVSSAPSLIIAYVTQMRANAYNPWGLYLNGLQEKTKPEEIQQIWQQSRPLVGSEDLQGNLIVASRKEYIAPPLFDRIRFFNWYPLYPQFPEPPVEQESDAKQADN